MISSWLGRPLTWLLAGWIVVAASVKSRGGFAPAGAKALTPYLDMEETPVEALVLSPAREDLRGRKLIVRARRVSGQPVEARLLAYLPGDVPAPALPLPGESCRLVGRLRLARRARNPGDFDERGYLSDHGVAAVMDVRDLERTAAGSFGRWTLARSAERTRRFALETIEEAFATRATRGVMEGVLLGEKRLLPFKARRDAQDAGVMHLLVPSGTKIAFAMAGTEIAGIALGLWPWQRFLAGILAGGYYTLVVGALPPYLRAFLTITALYAAKLFGRGTGAGFQALTVSALLILMLDPAALFDAGFQMTYLAVLGLMAARDPLDHERRLDPGLAAKLRRRAWESIRATIVVDLMLWPLFAKLFHRGPLAGALANPLAIPLAGALAWLGFALCLARALGLMPIFRAVACPADLLATGFRRLCALFASLPAAAMDLPAMTPWEIALYYLVVLLLLLPRNPRARSLAIASVMAATAASWTAGRCLSPPLQICRLWLAKSDAALLRFHGADAWVLARPEGAGAARRALKALGWGKPRRFFLIRSNIPSPLRLGQTKFLFPGRSALRRAAPGQCDIIRLQLRLGAALISSDGEKLTIRRYNPRTGAFDPSFP